MPTESTDKEGQLPNEVATEGVIAKVGDESAADIIKYPVAGTKLVPVLDPTLFLCFFTVDSQMTSRVNFEPSVGELIVHKVGSVATPVLVPEPGVLKVLSAASFRLPRPDTPVPRPVAVPEGGNSPVGPGFFFGPSRSVFDLSGPKVLSGDLLVAVTGKAGL